MSRGASKITRTTTIIKRSSKKKQAAQSGGAWKVAFADFTLAMMALFMVLWIVNSVTQEEREEIVALLNGYSIFDGNIFSPINSLGQLEGKKIVINVRQPVAPTRSSEAEEIDDDGDNNARLSGSTPSLDNVIEESKMEMEELARIIFKITEHYDAQANLKVEIVPQGLRILIQDDKSREMFQRSSATLTPFFNQLLMELAPVFEQIDNELIITGHTDSVRYRNSAHYNNWNLSGERALAARRALERGGLKESKVLQVNAMSDQMLLAPDDPTSAQNRRIEVMVLTKTASDKLYQFFGRHGTKVVEPAVERITDK